MTTIHLFVAHDRNRALLADWLAESYEVTTDQATLPDGTDLCVVDERGFARQRDRLEAWKTDHRPVFSPVLLVSEDAPSENLNPEDWETIDGLYVIDEIVSIPVEKAVLYRRLENLLERRSLSRELSTRYERSQERFSSLFHATPDPAFVVVEGALTYVNDAFCDVAAANRQALVGTPVAELSAFDDASVRRLLATVDTALTPDDGAEETGTDESTVLRSAAGDRYFEPNVNPMRLADSSGVVVLLRDVTERLRRERALRQSQQRFEQIAANVNELIWLIDVETGTVEYVSPGYERMLGEDFEVEADQPPSDFVSLVHPDDAAAVESTIEQMLSDAVSGQPADAYHFEFRIENADHGVRWLEGDGYPIVDEDGAVTRYVGVFEDFTEYKERQRLLERKNERLDEFAGIVSHDLRNPIQVLIARLDRLEHGEAVDEHLPAMERSVLRMERLIDDLLSLAREGETVTDLESVSLDLLASDAWETVDAPSGRLVIEADSEFEADRSRCRQLLGNLFRNAIEHGDGAMRVWVGPIEANERGTGFYVADDGPGIPEDQRERVLERGYSTQDNGTGFGLNIVADIVEAHGWDMNITESERGGARFEFTDLDH